MGYFKSWRFHYHLGALYGIRLRARPSTERITAIYSLDRWAYDREAKQNADGNNPNPVLSPKQLREAAAWGRGARISSGMDLPYPSPPYPEDYQWS